MLTGKFIIEHIRDGVVIERMEFENKISDKASSLIEIECPPRDIVLGKSQLSPMHHFLPEHFPDSCLVARFNFPKPITLNSGDELSVKCERPPH